MAAVSHAKSVTVGDATGTVTFWNGATTSSIAATDLARPSDFNSAHNFFQTISGNTAGQSTASGTNLVIGGTNQITASLSTAAGAATLWLSGPPAYTAMSYQPRQLGASTTILCTNTSVLWIVPFRLAAPLSASTLQYIESHSGTITSAATAQRGETRLLGIYSQHSTNTSRFETLWTDSRAWTQWNSGTSSGSYNYGGTTSSSAGSNLLTASFMGNRLHNYAIGSVMPPGLYLFAMKWSTSSAGYSAAGSRAALYFDNPVAVGMGTINQATANSGGYADAGTYSAGTAALPGTIFLSEIIGSNNQAPFFKIGAL